MSASEVSNVIGNHLWVEPDETTNWARCSCGWDCAVNAFTEAGQGAHTGHVMTLRHLVEQRETAVEALAPLVAEWQACGHCDGSCESCREDSLAGVNVVLDVLTQRDEIVEEIEL